MSGVYKNEDTLSFNVGDVSQGYNGYHVDDVVKNAVPSASEDVAAFKVGALAYEDGYWDGYGDNPWSSNQEVYDFEGVDDTYQNFSEDDDVDEAAGLNNYPELDDGWSSCWSNDDDYNDGWGWPSNGFNNSYSNWSPGYAIPDEVVVPFLRITTDGPIGEILGGSASMQFSSQAESVYPVYVADDTNIFVGSISSDVVIGRESGFDNYMAILSHGNDWFFGGKLRENVSGGAGDDIIFTKGGFDEVSAGKGYDTVFAQLGDSVGGGDQVDAIIYASPSDVWGADAAELDDYYPGVTSDIKVDLGHAQNGSAEIDGRTSTVISFENVISGPGNDILIGDDLLDYGGNQLCGMAGDDTISGGWGDDLLWGGAGIDHLTGGPGSDVFFYGPEDSANGYDVITDYDPWEDVIDVSALGTGADFHCEHSGGNTQIFFGDDYLIELSGYYSADDITVHA